MNNEIEIWKDIPEYEGLYQCSSLGRIKKYYKNGKEKILKPFLYKGYFQYRLSKQSVLKTFRAHKLVAMSFLNYNQRINGFVVDHIDNNKLNNKLYNIQIISYRENSSKDQFRHNRSSQYVGVTYFKRDNNWRAQIQYNKKNVGLGYFKTEIEASEAYKRALKKINTGTFIHNIREIKGYSYNIYHKRFIVRIKHFKNKSFKTEIEATSYVEEIKTLKIGSDGNN